MGDENEVNIVSESEEFDILSQKDDDLEEEGGEYVSSAHQYNIEGDLIYSMVQTNDKRKILTKEQSKPIIEVINKSGTQNNGLSTNRPGGSNFVSG